MTNQMRFTPPTNTKTMTAADRALRGNMGSANFLQRGTGKAGLSRAEIIANKNASEKAQARRERFNAMKARMFPTRPTLRIARIVGTPSEGMRVVGQGQMTKPGQMTIGELCVKLVGLGYTGYVTGKRPVSFAS